MIRYRIKYTNKNMKIHFIITASFPDIRDEVRKAEYITSIKALIHEVDRIMIDYPIETHFIIVENNGNRRTFFNDLCETYIQHHMKIIYTNHNQIQTSNKGFKELLDIGFVFQHAKKIDPEDMVVKITGRYRVGVNSTFLHVLYRDCAKYDAFVRCGSLMNPSQKMEERDEYDCLTGLFAMRAGLFMKEVDYHIHHLRDYEWVEWAIIMMIQTNFPKERIYMFDYLGVWIKTAYMKEYMLY